MRRRAPSTPVEVLGLDGLPAPGDTFQVINDPAKARQIAMYRQQKEKETHGRPRAAHARGHSSKQLKEGSLKELAIIIKADVGGSAEVLADTLQKLSDEQVKIRIIHVGRRRDQRVGRPAGARRRTPSSSASTCGPAATRPTWPSASTSTSACTRSSTT